MGKTFSVHSLLDKQFKVYLLDDEWERSIGQPEEGFSMLITGESGQGKTTFCLKLAKQLSKLGKVYYNSFEQGESSSLQKACIQCKMEEIKKGMLIFGHLDSFLEMKIKLKTNRAKFVFIDSLDYMNLTQQQFKFLKDNFKKKCFVVIAWSENGKPKSKHAKAIEYMADIKTTVHRGEAFSRSRYGATTPYQIFDTPFTDAMTKNKSKSLYIPFTQNLKSS